MRPPNRSEFETFLSVDGGWATQESATDHDRWEKTLDDGRVLRTKWSHGRSEIGDQNLWRHTILREQLEVSEDDFWQAVRSGIPPSRASVDVTEESPAELPGWLVNCLIYAAHYRQDQIAEMTLEQAEAAWLEFRSKPKR